MEDKTQEIELDDLIVNCENYRFDPLGSEKEAILKLLDVYGKEIVKLARDIAEYGLNPLKRMSVKSWAEDKFIVLEGNRRITALKLSNNPNFLTEDYPYKKDFTKINSEFNKTIPTKAEFAVFTDATQEIADRWINLEHTGINQGVGIVPWGPEEKGRFRAKYQKKTPSNVIQLIDFLRENAISTKDIDPTNLERLISTSYVREKIGIDFVSQKLQLTKDKKVVLSNLEKIINKMGEKEFSVGLIYDAGLRKKWIDGVLGLAKSTEDGEKLKTNESPHGNQTSAPQEPVRMVALPPANIIYRPRNYSDPKVNEIIESIMLRFPEVVNQFKNTYKSSHNLKMNNEYDVQYLLQGLLKLYIDDVRIEEWTPSSLGGSKKIDIFLYNNKIGIETKMVYATTTVKKLEEQLAQDIIGFRSHPNCKKVFFYVYDPVGLPNKHSIMSKVASLSSPEFPLEIIVSG